MYQRSVLDNKLRVLTSTMDHTQSVSMVICVGAGSRYESDELAGVSHFIEHLPFKGTENWTTARAVSEAIEGVGGVMNASTDREMTVFWIKVARLHYKTAFAVLMDMLLYPRLDPEEVEKEREVIQEELRMTYDQPSYRVDLLIDEAMWPDQAMGRDVGGTLETVADIQQKDIREYMHRLESLIREKIETNVHTGRYQLQSFSIERTHWHYMLDTATGELYRMELGRKPQQSEWMLIAKGILDPGDLPPLEEPVSEEAGD